MRYYSDRMRHLICEPYSVANLHEMAKALDIKRCWYHATPYPHYDIPKRRIKEIQDKTTVISPKTLLLKIKAGLTK